jgi:hypothetical protein
VTIPISEGFNLGFAVKRRIVFRSYAWF